MKTTLVTFVLLIWTFSLFAQDISWKPQETIEAGPVNLFHSTMAVNLPTAETLRQNEFEYEILHRFNKTVDANKAYFGIDGPATIRMALSYAITNDLMMTYGRSNQEDNIDLRVKYKAFHYASKTFPILLALQARRRCCRWSRSWLSIGSGDPETRKECPPAGWPPGPPWQ